MSISAASGRSGRPDAALVWRQTGRGEGIGVAVIVRYLLCANCIGMSATCSSVFHRTNNSSARGCRRWVSPAGTVDCCSELVGLSCGFVAYFCIVQQGASSIPCFSKRVPRAEPTPLPEVRGRPCPSWPAKGQLSGRISISVDLCGPLRRGAWRRWRDSKSGTASPETADRSASVSPRRTAAAVAAIRCRIGPIAHPTITGRVIQPANSGRLAARKGQSAGCGSVSATSTGLAAPGNTKIAAARPITAIPTYSNHPVSPK